MVVKMSARSLFLLVGLCCFWSTALSETQISTSNCTSVVKSYDGWPGKYNGELQIPIEEYINGWTLELAFSDSITRFRVWGAKIKDETTSSVKLVHRNSNKYLNPGSTLSISFTYSFRSPSNPMINSVKFNDQELCKNDAVAAVTTATTTTTTTKTSTTTAKTTTTTPKTTTTKTPETTTTTTLKTTTTTPKTTAATTPETTTTTTPETTTTTTLKTTTTTPKTTAATTPETTTTTTPETTTTTTPKTTTTTTPETTTTKVKTCTNLPYDYDVVLHKSLLFYEAQRSGELPDTQRVTWRRDSALDDAEDDDTKEHIDLKGGYYDAGDYMKFGFPMAAAATVLAWGAIENKRAYEDAGEWSHMKEAVKWATDYFIKAHVSDFVFYGQVGKGEWDHAYWGRPEDMTMKRPAYKITKDKPGSDLAGETAAALAAASILFRDSDPTYADNCLQHAKKLYEFADTYRGNYSDSIPDAKEYYKSWSSYGDELAWAAVWLYRATNETFYLTEATDHYEEFNLGYLPFAFSWDQKAPGVQVLLAQLTDETEYKKAITSFCDDIMNNKPRTPKRLVHILQWGSLRYASNAVFVCLRAAALGIKPDIYRDFAKEQIHYILGDTNRSFVVGFGNNSPERPHHASSSCPDPPATCDWSVFSSPEPNPHPLNGALVGGPDINDVYEDKRDDYIKNEVTCDYNAGFQSAVAELRSLYCA
ncbi:uncharacterized protein LOC143029762 [Oratosquilla oratoria]|uniref:uncharacterized protein LOC143029762 n=1 Tax=Oratosquilla oratoria TaxID=337810 RepID=UPI003F76679D